MITGLGVDIIEVERIEKIIGKTPRFLDRIFTAQEKAYFESVSMNPKTIAGNFAAKEAVAKVLGTGIRGFDFRDLEVLRDPLGKPYVILHGGAKSEAEKQGIVDIMISISHCDTYAVANGIGIKGV